VAETRHDWLQQAPDRGSDEGADHHAGEDPQNRRTNESPVVAMRANGKMSTIRVDVQELSSEANLIHP